MITATDPGVTVGVMDRPCISAQVVDEMFALFSRYFEGHRRSVFEADLQGKDFVILLRAGEDLVGFSTMAVTSEQYSGEDISVIYSGDTIIDREYWGTGLLEKAFVEIALEIRQEAGVPLYWLLICSGFRTYRYLTSFMKEYWPRWEKRTPEPVQSMLDFLARKRFGAAYRNGIVKLEGGWLRPGVSPIDDSRKRHPHVAFFIERNPGHAKGEELVCFTRFEPDNFSRAGLRILHQVNKE